MDNVQCGKRKCKTENLTQPSVQDRKKYSRGCASVILGVRGLSRLWRGQEEGGTSLETCPPLCFLWELALAPFRERRGVYAALRKLLTMEAERRTFYYAGVCGESC